ncbi:KamA family radical SAM protein, partial [bacterium]|nr:KamA family radical SAM protein [bacterium]MBU1026015.1 KamA family radical SAM protein [bacterium]
TPYYLSLISPKLNSGYDSSVRAQVIPPLSYVKNVIESNQNIHTDFDFMLERDTSPIDLVTRRYPKVAIFKPHNTCPQICVYCQRNWEIDEVNAEMALAPKEKIDAAMNWFMEHPEVSEVLITGGDPLMLGKTRLEPIIKRFSEMPHIERIRIGTRIPVTVPMRINSALIEILKRYHKPQKREICIVTHFQSVVEVTPAVVEAIRKIREIGVSIYNQQVFTFYVSRRFESVALKRLIKRIGVDPYYTFNTKGKDEMHSYRVPIARILQERREETRLFPGMIRLDEPVYNVPGFGKNYLKAWQNHRVIMITPRGTRIYEFHPWEKSINPVQTYISEDVSIQEYLQELKKIGENPIDYKSIWYYY